MKSCTVTYHADDTSNEVEVLQVRYISHIGGWIDLKGVMSTGVFKEAEHWVEEVAGHTEEPFPVKRREEIYEHIIFEVRS